MDAQEIIARRVAQELHSGNLVNLGIGIPTLVANYVPPDLKVFFQSENGLIGTGPIPEQGLEDPLLTDAGGRPISALPGACTFDSAMSFGLIRGGHVDVTVLGALQVDARGHLANWMIPGKMVPGMGGAMDLVTGAKRVIVAMQHAAKGKSKIVKQCNLPLTSARPVHLVVTDLAVIGFPGGKATLLETAPGVSVGEVMADFPHSTYRLNIQPQYRNMKQIVDHHPAIIDNAMEAIRRAGLEPVKGSIRGSTDGSRLSFMGLPCPNIFAGEHAFHSRTEWVSVQDMEAAVRTIVHLAAIWEERA